MHKNTSVRQSLNKAGSNSDIDIGSIGPDLLDGGLQLVAAAGLEGVLSLSGGAGNDGITVGRDAAGKITASVPVPGAPTVANTSLIQVFGQAGADIIALDEANGALPKAGFFGGDGNDVLTGGSGADQLFGGADNDTLFGKGGADQLFGGEGNDILTGGDGDDIASGGAGNDRFVWNPGDDSDIFDGDTGADTVEINGGNGAETFTVAANGLRLRIDRVNPAPFSIDAGTTENVVINANGGDDVVNASTLPETLAQLTIDGGVGNDALTGSRGNDVLLGGDGNDTVIGGRGDDIAVLGVGDDTFTWNPGDGSDAIEGQAGLDTLAFNGSNAGEAIDISANGGRVRLLRDVADVIMDFDDVEAVRFQALGGADRIKVGDLSSTDLAHVRIDLAGTLGGLAGDNQADQITIDGTAEDDVILVSTSATSADVVGLSAKIVVDHAESGSDTFVISGGAGDDVILAGGGVSGGIGLTFIGGIGKDVLVGGAGSETLFGGAGNDVLIGAAGSDRFDFQGVNGTDRVKDFENGLDHIRISGYGASLDSFGDLAGDIMQAGANVQINLSTNVAGAGTIVLENLQVAHLDASDFLFV